MVSPTHLSSRPLSRRCPLAAGGTRAANSLAGCGTGHPDAIFYMFKGEIFDYFQALLQKLRAEQPRYSFVHDVASNPSAGFARRNPPNAENYDVSFASYLLVISPAIIAFLFAQRWAISGLTQGAVK